MKYVYSAALLATIADAAHNFCAGAMKVTSMNSSTFANADTVDTRGNTACGNTSYFRDQYFNYTSTCDGSGLVSISGNENFTQVRVGVFNNSDCASTSASMVSSERNKYSEADMTIGCVEPARKTIDVTPPSTDTVQRFQFVAVKDVQYLIAVGTTSDLNASLDGEFDYQISIQCAAPASNNPAMPTPIAAGISAFSNVGGSSLISACSAGNDVFLEYDALCRGNVEIALVPPPSGYDGFHGEDFKIGVYQNAAAYAADTELACQDDPAIITNNISANPTAVRGGALVDPPFGAGKVLIVVGSYGSDIAPFQLEVSEMYCPSLSPTVAPTAAPTNATAETSAAPALAAGVALFASLLL